MSDEVDRILDVIDGGLQSSVENGYGVKARDGCCTRCVTRPLVEGSDFCEECRTFLLGDGPDPRQQGRVFYMGDRSPDEDEGFLTLRTVHALRDAITGRFVNGGDFTHEDVDLFHDPGQSFSLHNHQGHAIDITHSEDLIGSEYPEYLEEVERGLEQAFIRLHTNSITANDIAPIERTDFVRQEHEGNWVELEDAEPVTWVQTEEGGDLVNAEPITWSSDAWRSGLIVEGVAYDTPDGLVVVYAEQMATHLGERDESMTHLTES